MKKIMCYIIGIITLFLIIIIIKRFMFQEEIESISYEIKSSYYKKPSNIFNTLSTIPKNSMIRLHSASIHNFKTIIISFLN